MSERMKRAEYAWGGEVPEFVRAIIKACEAPNSSQNKVARKLGYSGAAISQVIANKYQGETDMIADKVRMVLLQSTVDCPALGEIPELGCVAWQEEAVAEAFKTPFKVKMAHACRRCPKFTKGQS